MRWACTESQLSEKMILKKKAVLDPDDDGKTVVILSRLVFWGIEIRADPRQREILRAKMKLDGANTKSEATPAVKVQEWISTGVRKTRQRDVTVQECNNESKPHV